MGFSGITLPFCACGFPVPGVGLCRAYPRVDGVNDDRIDEPHKDMVGGLGRSALIGPRLLGLGHEQVDCPIVKGYLTPPSEIG